jgi:sporulation protein YlmC with PRC-barrel domain
MEKITQLLSMKVVTEEGEYLGRVIDVRSDGDPEHGIHNKDRKITEVLYGTQGLLQVVGLLRTEVQILPWTAVKKISGRGIVVNKSDLK